MKQRIILILTVAAVVINGLAANPKSPRSPIYFHDRLISSEIVSAGEKLISSGRHTPANTLRAQLARPQCNLELPKPSSKMLSAAELVELRRSGVLIVSGLYKCDRCDKWHDGNASGVALSTDGVFATCYHVIAATNHTTFVIRTLDGRTAPVVEVLAADEKSDVAICRAAGIRLNPVPLAADNPPAGSQISVISHPKGRFFTLTTGHISRYFFKPISKTRSVPFMAITAEFAKGSSGGPVFDGYGNLAGLAASTYSIYYNVTKDRKDNFQMVLRQCPPMDALRRLIRTD